MEIKIGRSARACCVCQRLFVHNEELSSLVRIEKRQLVRDDYCKNCWSTDRAAEAFSAWSSRFLDPKVEEQAPPETFSPLRTTFYELAESDDRPDIATAYLAAQLLRRQKVFRLLKESDNPDAEMRVSVFIDRINNKIIEVRDPSLSHEELQDGRRVLMQRLSDLESPQEAGEDVEHAEV